MTTRHASASIDDTAAAWVARCDRGPLSANEQAALDAWLAADRRHLGAHARATAVFAHFDRARALGAHYDPDTFEAVVPAPKHMTRRHFLWAAGTAAAAGLAGVALLRPGGGGRHVATRLGEVLRLPLSDGSAITLNSATELVVEFSRARRQLRLLRGEALFDVAKDASRPFVVQAARASVVAVGTSFTVQRTPDDAVEVMVREGVVEFDTDALAVPPVRLGANTMALAGLDNHIKVEPLRPLQVGRKLAWREGMISFDGDTLAQAAAQFARYSSIRIVIDDPAVAQRRVVGLYSASNPVGFARAVALSMHLHAERRGATVHLSAHGGNPAAGHLVP